ncbi:hypothetical protein NF27_GT00010 [Candidatus Jidaibacter acanthamoeba]|uniref:Uncharacterized protein n=1 Tax=Candidatus Jidaibacter acanthamoebae TaxID=86105 RepID=A0A0C1QXC8_9RICK|nr:hypothetical protein [Candidatus Jidaibacter acanthamoeba]KIE04665.1 hypothetical protein NF27_GT00010 [Candidatus Jidaibacter acanthamoeba]
MLALPYIYLHISFLATQSDKVTYNDVKEKAKEAYNNIHPSVPTSLDGFDLKKGSYESLRSQVMANTNLEDGNNNVETSMIKNSPKFTGNFKSSLSDNLNELSNHYSSDTNSNITNEVNETHNQVPKEIDKIRLNTNKEELKLDKEYKETKDTLHTVKAAKNVLKEEKE